MFLLDKESCAFSSSNFFGQKLVFTLKCKFLQTLIHTEKTREPIINVYMVFHYITWYYMVFQMFSILLQTARGILNSLICVVHFSNNFNSVFHKKGSWNLLVLLQCSMQRKKTDWIVRIFTFNDKNPLYHSLISTLQFFEGQSDQGVSQLVIKPFGIFQTSRIVSLS